VPNLYGTTKQVEYSEGPCNYMRGKNVYSDIDVLYIVPLKPEKRVKPGNISVLPDQPGRQIARHATAIKGTNREMRKQTPGYLKRYRRMFFQGWT
jgi:hypothetical protein